VTVADQILLTLAPEIFFYAEQAHHMWKESLDRAIKLLIEIDKFEPGVVNKKYSTEYILLIEK
jgi:hypothetical protein